MRSHRSGAAAVLVSFLATAALADEIARANLNILGISLEVDRAPVATGIDIPVAVQTIYGGKKNDEASPPPDLSVLGDLTGAGLDTPLTLATKPGRQFQIPALHQAGDYVLQNIRLVDRDGRFIQQAIPSFANITVADVLKTNVRVRQLSPEELRARGLNWDARSFDCFEITMVFAINGQEVLVPYTAIVDKRTHEVIMPPASSEVHLPKPPIAGPPPRFQPPDVFPGVITEDIDAGGGTPSGAAGGDSEINRRRPIIPAALVIPAGFGVLHQFFAIILNVSNNAPAGAAIRLENLSATLTSPLAMRVAKIIPPVTVGQAVPITDKITGTTFLVAQAEGAAEWTLEALRSGTHTLNVAIRATYTAPNQPDIPLKGNVSASVVVSDPRFQVNFVHPDNVRKGEPYLAGGDSGAAIVDVSTPSSPQLVWSGNTAGIARAIDIVGSTMGIADGDGIAFYDANDPANPRFIGLQNVGGVAWDLIFNGSSLIAANDLGIAIIDRIYAPPHIAPALIGISSDGVASATISGSALAVSPAAATVVVKNATTGVIVTTTPAATGSFATTIAAKAGHQISVTATDAASRSAVRSIGAVPFVTTVRNDAAVISGDTAFRSRRIASDGVNWFVTNGTLSGAHINGGSSRALLFRQPDASSPAQLTNVDAAVGTVEDTAMRNGFGFAVGDRLATINMAGTPQTVQVASDPCGRELAIAISGNNAFTAETDCGSSGGINIYDVANPAAPVLMRSQSLAGVSGVVYRALIPFGTQYFIAISPDKPAGVGRDVTIIDRSNLNSLVKIAELDVPNFDAFSGVVEGRTLYLAGGETGVAVVDLTNPMSPVWRSTTDTPGIARAVAVTGPSEIVVADAGGPGLTFLDTSDRMRPIVLGSQPLQGNPVDVKVFGSRIYVATETRSYVVTRP